MISAVLHMFERKLFYYNDNEVEGKKWHVGAKGELCPIEITNRPLD